MKRATYVAQSDRPEPSGWLHEGGWLIFHPQSKLNVFPQELAKSYKEPLFQRMTARLMSKLRPNLGAKHPEPSLYKLVFGYYREHFPEDEARRLTKLYITDLNRQIYSHRNTELGMTPP